ncbi:ribosomal maturation YjgA family protein [Asaia krungthepensis]|uniref:DUF2809 domain-containing protein n=1 Tax=Asaia krungthepensis NRIC 0535 TaxID=1307925 RepID=A0ABQ0Q2V2_9PROT|nr:DUF2809 domain-containing protein [Asaia krungthepensis]GBQ88735.1 hypothetical protein AA0535_1614 [Asaia krungthepensis NRIC 0535]
MALLTLIIIAAGIACRLAPLGLDPAVQKWGGSILWGSLFWCLAALILPGRHRSALFALACLGAFGSEGLKLVHIEPLDTLRSMAAGRFLLGQHFSWSNMAAYLLGMTLVTPLRVCSNPGPGSGSAPTEERATVIKSE